MDPPPTITRTGPDPYVKWWMLGVILSAMGYGVVVTLAICCLNLLSVNPLRSRRLKWFLFAYILFMVALSTASMAGACQAILNHVFLASERKLSKNLPIAVKVWASPLLVVATWLADGFMAWRCHLLYQETSSPKHKWVIYMVLSLLAAISLGAGFIFIILQENKGWLLSSFLVVTALVNIVLAMLIAVRILRHQNYLQNALGPSAGTYWTKAIVISVESAALIATANLAYIILDCESFFGTVMLINVFVHVYVISPFMIIYRVAQGKAATPTPTGFDAMRGAGRLRSDIESGRSPMRFVVPTPTHTPNTEDETRDREDFQDDISADHALYPLPGGYSESALESDAQSMSSMYLSSSVSSVHATDFPHFIPADLFPSPELGISFSVFFSPNGQRTPQRSSGITLA